jgi:formylglycine-generating enzyme required for sulfatase activity
MSHSVLSPLPSIQGSAASATVILAGDCTLYPFLDTWIDQLLPGGDFKTRYFSEAAFYYQMMFGRQSLVNFIQNHQAEISYPPTDMMDALNRQGSLTLIDLGIFGTLRRYLTKSAQPFDLITSEIDLSYSNVDKPSAFQLAGDLSSPLSMVIHECDLVKWEDINLGLLRQVIGQLLNNPIIWIGGDLRDPLYRQWRQLLTGIPSIFSQPQIVIQPRNIPVETTALWAEEDVDLISDLDLISAASKALELVLKKKQRSISAFDAEILRRRPYKFLDYFSEGDRDFFFGREHKIKSLFASVMKAPLVLLCGPSGVGKTSLLRAGIRPNLTDRGISSTYLSLGLSWEDIKRDLIQIQGKAVDRALVVIFDQAEEMFTRLAIEERESLFKEIEGLLNEPKERIHVLISFREDFLGSFLSWLHKEFPIYSDNVKLDPLSPLEARQAIEKPAEQVGVTFEPKVVDHILEELDDDGIMPSQLQIVCDRLFDQRDVANVIRTKHYEAAGRASGILNDYLQVALQRFSHPHRQKAQTILRTLVNPLGWRSQRSKSDIQQKANLPTEEVDWLLTELVASRLVRSLERAGNQLFELAHDILAMHLQQWIHTSRQRALEVAQLLTANTGIHLGGEVDLGKEKLVRISAELTNPHLQLDRDQVKNILQSALLYGIAVSEWVRRNVEMGVDVWAILFPFLSSNDEILRKHGAFGLAGIPGPIAIEQLNILMNDASPQVRVAAHQTLYKIGTPEARELLDKSKRMRLVPSGPFTMGRPPGLLYVIREYVINQKINFPGPWMLAWNESPAHVVNLPAFFVGRTLVTRAEYMEFVQSDGYQNPTFWTKAGWSWRVSNARECPDLWDDAHYADPEFPVIGVAWFEAIAYAHWAGLRLLTEAEWEKAGRGTDERHFPWGNTFDESLCNTREGGVGGLTRVGTYSPQGDSPYGIADLSGNVWEWTNSIYEPYPYSADDGREDLEDGDLRVLRGGSWIWIRNNARLVGRGNDAPGYASHNLGFRCGADAEIGGTTGGMLG